MQLIEPDPSSKFQITKNPPLPAKCAACGKEATGRNYFLDFNMSLDYYGAVIFCESCLQEIADLVDHPVAEARSAELEEEIEDLKNELDRYKFVIASLGFVRPDLDLSTSVAEQDVVEDADSIGDEESRPVEDESGVNESDSSRRLKVVSEPPSKF